MRDLVFTLSYEPGSNPVADVLAEHPEARVRSLSLHVTPERLWRVDHASGGPNALSAIEDTFRTNDYYADCLATDDCGAVQTTQVLEHTADTLVLYSYWERTDACVSVPHMALDHLGAGALFETRHEGRAYTWRIIHSGDGDVRAFFDELASTVGDRAEMEIRRLSDADPPTRETEDRLPPEQEAALHAAIDHGYYETPRTVDAAELAERLDVPRSTLTYRLRRAEAHLARRYASRTQPPEQVRPTR
jgi:predicted DNA binding protein